VTKLPGEYFDLAVADVARQICDACQLQLLPEKGVTRVRDNDVAFAFLRDKGCITLGGVCPRPARPA